MKTSLIRFFEFILYLYLIVSINSMGLYENLSNKKDVLIVNYNEGCRYCTTLVDYANQIYSFIECNTNYDIRQRFDISRGKSNEIFSYIINNKASKANVLKIYPNSDIEFYILQNKNGSNSLISANSNLCLTNPTSVNTFPYHISQSIGNINLMFTECEFNNQVYSQEFFFEKNVDPWYFKGRIKLYYYDTTNLLSTADINLINSNYPDYRFIMFYNSSSKLYFSPSSNNFEIEVPANETNFILGSNDELINNSSYNCIYNADPKSISTSTYTSPFFSRDKCQLSYNFSLEYYIEIRNKVEFKFINLTLGNYLNSSFLASNSDILFTHSNGTVFRYNLATSSFTSFIANLPFGQYNTSISIKPNINYESNFRGLSFNVDSCNYTTFNIPFVEKINNVKFTIVNEAGGNLSTSNFALNTNIVFTRSSNNQTYTYNIGSGNQTNFTIALHHDTYTISSTPHFEWTRLTNSVNIVDFDSTQFNIVMRENTAQATFSFRVSNLSNASTNSCVVSLNTDIVLRMSNNRTVSKSITNCTSTVVFNLYYGTWYIDNFSLAPTAKDSMLLNSGQSYNISNYNNISFNFLLTKLLNKIIYRKFSIGDGTVFNLNGIQFNCGSNYYMNQFHFHKGYSNTLNAWISCKELNSNSVYQANTGWNETIGNYDTFNYLDRHNLDCADNYAIQNFWFESSGTNIRFNFICIQLPTPSSCDYFTSAQLPTTGYIDRLDLLNIGDYVGYLNQFVLLNNYSLLVQYWSVQSCLLYNFRPFMIYKYFAQSNLNSGTYEGSSGLNIDCPDGQALVFVGYIHTGSMHQCSYSCRTLKNGVYGNLTTNYTGWNTGGWHIIYFERQTLDCGSTGILKGYQMEYDGGSGNIRTRFQCYSYYEPAVRVYQEIDKSDCVDFSQIHFNGFTFGDGNNFLSWTDQDFYNGSWAQCMTRFHVLVPLV